MKTVKILSTAMLMLIDWTGVTAQTINEQQWTIVLDQQAHTYNISYAGQAIVTNGFVEARNGDSELKSTDATDMQVTQTYVDDCFGTGHRYTISYVMPSGETLLQTLSFYEQRPYLVCQLALTAPDGAVSNRLCPLGTTTPATFLPSDRKNRMLWVPWDNDGWVRYQSYYLNRTMNSISATALFNADTRQGLVVGALDHDTWKSAIHVEASNYSVVDAMQLISGYTDQYTRDTIDAKTVVPHSAVKGDTVRSSRFVVGLFDDWRMGLETYADACTLVKPRRVRSEGKPYAWNTWGVMQDKVTYKGVLESMRFIHDQLMPHGFHDRAGYVVLSLDAWVTFTDDQIRQFVDSCEQLNMIPGMYLCPFVDWNKSDRAITGTSRYTYKDLWLKHQGQYVKMTDAYALDPTHPGTKIAMLNDINRYKRLGIKFVKLDFMCHAAVEADKWYNPDCQTGLQAYNEGMDFIRKQFGDEVYLNLSIAPIFPYHQVDGRRICCDAYSSIDNTEYVMNSTSFGWWLSNLYICDPDNMVFKSIYNGGTETVGENRARLTSGVCTGMFGNGDSYSDDVPAGYPSQSRERALQLLTNEEVNVIPRTIEGAFRPVNGNDVQSNTNSAENLLVGENDHYLYLAVINYQRMLMPLTGTALFSRLGIDPVQVVGIKELWTGETVTPSSEGFNYNVPARDARIYRIEKLQSTEAVSLPEFNPLRPAATQYYSLSGRRLEWPQKKAVNLVFEADGTIHKLIF